MLICVTVLFDVEIERPKRQISFYAFHYEYYSSLVTAVFGHRQKEIDAEGTTD